MIGAPALTAGAALRIGAGLVKILCESSLLPHILTIEPCATGIESGSQIQDTLASLKAADADEKAVLAIGPGLGQGELAWREVETLVGSGRKMVIDADALNILSQIRPGGITSMGKPQMVLTPHPGEFKRLASPLGITSSPTDPQQRPTAAVALAKAFTAVVVLKGKDTIIADPNRCFVNHAANPALATAGSGDVLTGIIAGLMAQQLSPWDAAVLGVHLHTAAGNLWLHSRGPSGLTAMDLMKLIPEAVNRHREDQ
jgi:NAD(P)H-hydrate epimerase